MTRPRLTLAVIAMAAVALVATGCRTGADVALWGPCTPGADPTGTDGTYALVCQNGEWTPVMTAGEYVRISRGEPNVVIAPLPKRPATPTTTTTAPTTTVAPTTTAPTTTSSTVPTTTSSTVPAVVPRILYLSPRTGSTAGGTTVTISGSGFTPASSVTIGGSAATDITVVDSTTVLAATPPAAAGAANVVVTTAGGTATFVGGFTYVTAPTLDAVTPNAITANGSESLVITGTGLATTASVMIGTTPATLSGPPTDTTVLVTVSGVPAGTHDLVVTTQYGTITLTDAVVADI